MTREPFFQFNPVPYPLWRRRLSPVIRPFSDGLLRRAYPVTEDAHPPATAARMAQMMDRFGLLPELDRVTLRDMLRASEGAQRHPGYVNPAGAHLVAVSAEPDSPAATASGPVRLPAQWEPQDAVMLTWPVLYPPLWPLYAQMSAAIVPVAYVAVVVPSATWAHAAWVYLTQRSGLSHEDLTRVRFLVMPSDDIWIRDYGPMLGHTAEGQPVAIDAIYDHHPAYPQARDDALPRTWAAHTHTPLVPLALHIEGGNLLTDGAGTLFTTERTLAANPYHTRETLETLLRETLGCERLHVLPRLPVENTGHVDLLVKPLATDTLLVAAPNGWDGGSLRALRRQLGQATNAQGEAYTLIDLPTPRPYVNWFLWPIFRSYTNALLCNGRALVPVYGLPSDEAALRVYEQALPGYTVLPIDLSVGINGGGAVHCMTREVPARRGGA